MTQRLELVPATVEMLAAEIADPQAFARTLGAELPDDWPPGEYDHDAQHFFLSLLEANPLAVDWLVRYVIMRDDVSGNRVMVGALGFTGPPDADGQAMMGYSVCHAYRQQGYATEAVQGMLDWASGHPSLKCVIAEVSPTNIASVRLLRRVGFVEAGEPSDSTMLRFERRFCS